MDLIFRKYQGTGNDFIMIDNRALVIDRSEQALFASWCDRRFGIGADGVILLQNHPQYAFEMVYINADGREGSMCGNGGRCAVQFAHALGLVEVAQSFVFIAVDGPHQAHISGDLVHLQMIDVGLPEKALEGWYLNTGSPHHMEVVTGLSDFPVSDRGFVLRWHEHYAPGGTNVNFVEILDKHVIKVRTFERGVEAETYSCGTGVTAAALLVDTLHNGRGNSTIEVHTAGGVLRVSFEKTATAYQNIVLIGPAKEVFQGVILMNR
jgi:diaminopimelate epimerase